MGTSALTPPLIQLKSTNSNEAVANEFTLNQSVVSFGAASRKGDNIQKEDHYKVDSELQIKRRTRSQSSKIELGGIVKEE